MTVGVVIPVYNGAKYVAQAVDSALSQTLTAGRVVVVDDGSTDETGTVLESFGNHIDVVRQENRGVSAARNAGAALAGGDHLAFLDADDVWEKDKLRLQVQLMEEDERTGLVHCATRDIDAEGRVISDVMADGLSGEVADELLLFRRPVILGGGSGMLVRRPAFDEVGGFDERLSTSADWDFFHRITRHYRVGFVPVPLLRYRIHDANMHGNVALMRHDMLIAFRKAFRDFPAIRPLRRRAYARLHFVLAGSFEHAGHPVTAAGHLARAILLDPSQASSASRKIFRRGLRHARGQRG